MNKFRVEITNKTIEGKLKYDEESLALVYSLKDPMLIAPSKLSSLVFAKTLEIFFDVEKKQLLYAEGYYPMQSWIKGNVAPPEFEMGEAKVDLQPGYAMPGVAIPLDGFDDSDFVFDAGSGWGLVGIHETAMKIKIADDIVLGFSAGILRGIWLSPQVLS